MLNGFDIAAGAVAKLSNCHLVFISAVDVKLEDTKHRLLECGISPNKLKLRSLFDCQESLERELLEADLAVMPSRTEGFGVIGLQALSAGLPILVGRNSGLGEALMKVSFGSYFVVDSNDPEVWAKAIKNIHNKERATRLRECEVLRGFYQETYSWEEQIKSLIEKLISITDEPPRDCQGFNRGAIFPDQQTEVTIDSHTEVSVRPPSGYHTLPIVMDLKRAKRKRNDEEQQEELNRHIMGEMTKCFVETHAAQIPSQNFCWGLYYYLQGALDLRVKQAGEGSLRIIVECRTLEILERLWEDYSSGHLNAIAEEHLLTDEVKRKYDVESIELETTILREDYFACKLSFAGNIEVTSTDAKKSEIPLTGKVVPTRGDDKNGFHASEKGLTPSNDEKVTAVVTADTQGSIEPSSADAKKLKIPLTGEVVPTSSDDKSSGLHVSEKGFTPFNDENVTGVVTACTRSETAENTQRFPLVSTEEKIERTAEKDDDGFDLIRPTLIQQLRKILDQYPDDGQILKELIQNAEDACASRVKFLHDKHCHSVSKLYHQGLAQFQGAALYAYNDAQFTKDDWKGIRKLCDSIKVTDPMKVGRFGLGFKSVFHMTDLPSIVSGSQIGVIDPHEEYFSDENGKRTGHRWQLKEDREIIDSIPDQFQPYKGILDCTEDTFKQESYNGTMFRFPLRTKPSKLSQTLYTTQKVQTLFESFEADAHLILLFLQYLESIELFVREETESDAKRTFQVRITNDTLQLVREKRSEFRSKISSGELLPEAVKVTYPITIEAITYSQGMQNPSERHSFLVTNFFCGGEISSEFRTLASDQDLSYLPLVGVAMALPERPENETPNIKGHVFCFLPLPVQKTSLTGLPVHVNGFFALSQNRRYIKTPTAEQEDLAEKEGQPLTDKSLLWNQCLLQEAIPKAYASVLLDAMDKQKYNVQSEAIYKAWPNIANIDQKWKRVEKPLFELLLDKRIIYTPAQGGKWLRVQDVIVERLAESDPKELLVNVFLAVNENVACLPEHALKSICLYSTLNAVITPSLTRRVLKSAPFNYSKLTRLEKLLLLKFVLQDGCFSEVLGLELLPISNELFASFSSSGEAVYISSPAHPRELLPCPQQKFLDESINQDLSRNLDVVANQGCTQLRHFTKDDVAELLSTSLPPGWSDGQTVLWYPGVGSHPSIDWLGNLWAYLGKNFSSVDELCRLQGLPLLPLDVSKVPITLVRLKLQSDVVVRSLHGDSLSDSIVGALQEFGVTVMQEYPGFLTRHPAVLGTFVHPPSTLSVLKAVTAVLSLKPNASKTISDNGKRYFRNFVAKASSLSPDVVKVLSCFPLFETLSGAFVSKSDGLCAAPDEVFPIKTLRDLIDVRESDAKRLAGLLDIKILTRSEVLLEVIFPDLVGQRYSSEDIDRLMEFVMDRYHVYTADDARFEHQLKDLPFVSTKTGRVRPKEVFDPRQEVLKRIFAEEDVFPVGKYNHPAALVILEYLGMKGAGEITGQNLYESAKALTNIADFSAAESKSSAIMSFLTSNPTKLEEVFSGTSGLGKLGMHLKSIPWISVIRRKPDNYPESLPFWGETHTDSYFLKPSDVKYKQAANIIGSVRPLVKAEPSSQLTHFFSWNSDPAVLDVVQHLQNVIRCYSSQDKPRYIIVAQEIYAFLSRADQNEVLAALENVKNAPWIWNGDRFSSPRFLLSQKPPIDLSPYICSLPSEVARFKGLFIKFGVLEKCNDAFLLEVLHLIKEKYDNHPPPPSEEPRKDLQLSVDILNEIKPKVGEQLPPELQEKVLIPTYVEDDAYVKLAPVDKCMYCEHEWLERSKHDGEEDEEMDYFYVHPNVPNSTAELLLVPTLMNRMLEQDELDIGEEFGQEEKLTRRLSRLLEDYTDGFAVPKELVQNADDAGATEVRFLYDERTNQDAMTCLIDEEMKHCQGPALWVYNDAEFRDEDFANITKLNGATKEQETEKIGKFGLGFNAVYNLTDVPMFLSRNYFVIFDPNTFYLGKAIRNKSKPGIKININKNTKRLRNLSNQFKPFNGIFNCDLHLSKDDNSYPGTLFRFPLRTKEQAIKSEIKQLPYDNKQMKELLKLFASGTKTLLLFTQNVRRVSIFHLPKDSDYSNSPMLMFEVNKSFYNDGVTRELSVPVTLPQAAGNLSSEEQYLLQQCNFLRASSEVMKHLKHPICSNSVSLSSGLTITIRSTSTEVGIAFVEDKNPLRDELEIWRIASSMGKGQAMQFAKVDKSLLPSGGVAAKLIPNECGKLMPVPVGYLIAENVQQPKGRLFCYLPLPICSGFPVHVNGAFAVASNRRSLKEKTFDDKSSMGVEWNNHLMQDSICEAYLDLLQDVKKLAADSYHYHALWPRAYAVEPNCEPLARSFYQRLTRGDYDLFSDGRQWVGLNHVVFLDPNLRQVPIIGELSLEVLKRLRKENEVIIDLPAEVFQSFLKYDLAEEIKDKSYDKSRFFRDLFFPNIASIAPEVREKLALYTLDDKNGEFDGLIKMYPCIPASPDGQTLKCPAQLINPQKTASLLFSPDERRFPFGTEKTFLNGLRLAKLEQLGMLTDKLTWDEVVERAESIATLSELSSTSAMERAKALMDHLTEKLISESETSVTVDIRNKFIKTRFLPVLKKPEKFPLLWKGEELHGGKTRAFVSPVESYLKSKKYLVCCSDPIVAMYIPENVKTFLDFDKRPATVGHVQRQLEVASTVNMDRLDSSELHHVKELCIEAYTYLQRSLSKETISETEIREIFKEKKLIFFGRNFLYTEQLAFRLGTDCSPYLHQLPTDLARLFEKLMKSAGVKASFEAKDFVACLTQLKERFGEAKLDQRSLPVAVNLAFQLGHCSGVKKIEGPQEVLFLPDSKGVMRSADELCTRDCHWMPDEIGVHFVNDMIPPVVSTRLGVKTRREEALRHFSSGIPFGQKEKLTNRLQRILSAYPCEKEILKELLQNADDAQATEICFIKDPRHHPDERVFEDSWKPLQGPALCVYNNKPFTEADIIGIQNLGEGSKGDDPNKTGQYGVGFNAVYHLTDAPSFASNGEEIGDVLCIFDPHCKYVPGATSLEPGRMFRKVSMLRKVFPDVFACYNDEEFPLRNSTMFRFPLRTEEMANDSKISKSPVTLQALDEMMNALKKELIEVMLFVNNITRITLCEVDPKTGKTMNHYFVESKMTEEDAEKRQEFASHVRQIGKSAGQRNNTFLNDIKKKKCSYVLNLRDSDGNQEKWLIVQQIGFDNKVQASITNAYQTSDLGMLPRGGVACLLENEPTNSCSGSRKKRAYCFLPLPIETNLPVHINGHFALDHEARRNLWRDETRGYRSDWNNALLEDVIAPCYLTLLDEVREFLHLPSAPDTKQFTIQYTKESLSRKIDVYEMLFPLVVSGETYWATLGRAVYRKMNEGRLRLLPVVRGGGSEGTVSEHRLTWLPPTGEGREKAFFNNLAESGCFSSNSRGFLNKGDTEKEEKGLLESRKRLEEILLETGFNLVKLSLSVCEAFHNSCVDCVSVSPSAVIRFYKTFNNAEPICQIGPISLDVEESQFKSTDNVSLLLKYCKEDTNFLSNLSGLPLLVTQDNQLRAFSTSDPKFLSRHHNILPLCRELFVHERLRIRIFGDVSIQESSVFKRFGVQDFATNLNRCLPSEFFIEDDYVRWFPTEESLPNKHWVQGVWNFLNEETNYVLRKIEQSEREKSTSAKQEGKVEKIQRMLQPLFNWSILPCTETSQMTSTYGSIVETPEHYLAPLSLAQSVIDFACYDESSKFLVEALKRLNLAEMNYTLLVSDSCYLARMLVASLKTPESLLKCFEQKLKKKPNAFDDILNVTECHIILKCFSDSVKRLSERDKPTLKRLPFYKETHGGLISVSNAAVWVIPFDVPRKEMDVLGRGRNVIFLEECLSLAPLFQFLQFQCISLVDVYCTFILQSFDIFSKEARFAHLEHIRHYILPNRSINDNDKSRLLACLKNTPVITCEDGSLRKVSSFYDPRNEVFKIMLAKDMFPPEPFNERSWLLFLEKFGLTCVVSRDLFKIFAGEVALEGATRRSKDTDEKSKVLVKHLFTRQNVVAEGLLQAVCDISFVATEPVEKEFRELHQQFGEASGQTPYISFKGSVFAEHAEIVWTAASLLPRWANPWNYQYVIIVPGGMSADDYYKSICTLLQVLTEPTLDLVTVHCQNVCFRLEKENYRDVLEEERCTRISVMRGIYAFLQKKAISNTIVKERLADTPCILVEEGSRFVRSKQIVLELYRKDEIRPFLYVMPAELSAFKTLFQSLGSSPSVKPCHYAMVLDMLQRQSMGNMLEPNEVALASRAVKGLFETLQDNPDETDGISILYLPSARLFSGSADKEVPPIVLTRSTELLFDDAPYYHDRIRKFHFPLVVDLRKAGVCIKSDANYKDLVKRLPAAVQPQMMSEVIEEKIVEDDDTSVFEFGAAGSLKNKFNSELFYRGIVRLIRHANQDGGFDQNEVATVRSSLQDIEFFGMDKVVTHLVHNGQVIQGSQREVSFFMEKISECGQEMLKVYINAAENVEVVMSALALKLSEVIAQACRGLLGNTVFYIPEILRCDPTMISSILDKFKIRSDDSYDAGNGNLLPEPGSFIPLSLHNLLNPAFKSFLPGEYVGYELDDPSLQLQEGNATFIYAVILEEVTTDSLSLLTKRFKINIGHEREPEVVEASELYQFHRFREIAPSAIVQSDQQGDPQSTMDKEQILNLISNMIEEAWGLSEEMKKQVFKRLILQWHPDKNPGNEALCTEVFQHIMSEIERVEKGEPRRREGCTPQGWTYQGSYGAFFQCWGARARRYKSDRQEYSESFARYHGSWSRSSWSGYVPPSFCATNPQPAEARRWFRQAEADLAAVDNDMSSAKPSYVWACFKCHQAAEKALKAAQYSVDSNKTNIHNLLQNSLALKDSNLTSMSSHLESLLGDSTRMRYPDQVCCPRIPSDIYTHEMACEALRLATRILDNVRGKVQ
ncbi:sacsin-like [Stylophora pistillata]|uniref:sacsin-like n=1 Tax=Stylophora pistillata TaxID=50429 RepID=UPI000C05299D|nr:sacsin-like [Stylophora pistillata]